MKTLIRSSSSSVRADEAMSVLCRACAVVIVASLAGCGVRKSPTKPPAVETPAPEAREVDTSWPTNREGLLFRWRAADESAEAYDDVGEVLFASGLQPSGLARSNRHFAMMVQGGHFTAIGLEESLLPAVRKSEALSVEILATPSDLAQGGPAWILSSFSDSGAVNLSIGQEGSEVVAVLRTSATGEQGARASLCRLDDPALFHVVMSYADGRLVCHLNGTPVADSGDVRGDLSTWSDIPFLFGAGSRPGHDWAGTIEGVAMYSRVIEAEEAQRNCEHYAARIAARKPVARLEIQARLLAKSAVPSSFELGPYNQALGVYEYAVEKVVAGAHDGGRIRVAHWFILDRERLPICDAPLGEARKLILEHMTDNPQLRYGYLANTLTNAREVPVYYDIALPAAKAD
jgi:hypothetical protein